MAKVTKVKKAVSRKRREKKNIDRGQAHMPGPPWSMASRPWKCT